MKNGYWKWLKEKLIKVWPILKLFPYALLEVFKSIIHLAKDVLTSEIKNQLTWESLCIFFGVFFCLTFMILIAGFWWLTLTHFVGTLILCGVSFLISTYAYWRGKP